MNILRREIEDSGLLILASPNYWCGVTGLMKTFIDRLYFYHHPVNSALIAGKKSVVLVTQGVETHIEYESSLIFEFFRRAMKSLQMELLDTVIFPGLMEKDDAASRSEYLQQAYDLGRRLGSL